MPFPGYPLATNKTNATPNVNDHPAHHNALATAANDLQAQVDAAVAAAISRLLIDAKGDLLVGTAADTITRQAVGADGYALVADSTQTNGIRYANIRTVVNVYTANDTWNKPTDLLFVEVEVVGGGGAGGGAPVSTATNVSGGLGGHAGGYARKIIQAASLAATVAVTVGQGGAGNSGAAGDAGTASSFGAHLSGAGGGGGSSIAAAAAATPRVVVQGSGFPGNGTNGDINATGGAAGDWLQVTGGSIVYPGYGGASFFGQGGRAQLEATGGAALSPGSGGGGMRNNGAQPARTGGAGANGVVIVKSFCAG